MKNAHLLVACITFSCAKFCHSPSILTPLSRQHTGVTRSYRNAQYFSEYSKIHREPMMYRLSLNTPCLLKRLCVSIAFRVTSCIGEKVFDAGPSYRKSESFSAFRLTHPTPQYLTRPPHLSRRGSWLSFHESLPAHQTSQKPEAVAKV